MSLQFLLYKLHRRKGAVESNRKRRRPLILAAEVPYSLPPTGPVGYCCDEPSSFTRTSAGAAEESSPSMHLTTSICHLIAMENLQSKNDAHHTAALQRCPSIATSQLPNWKVHDVGKGCRRQPLQPIHYPGGTRVAIAVPPCHEGARVCGSQSATAHQPFRSAAADYTGNTDVVEKNRYLVIEARRVGVAFAVK